MKKIYTFSFVFLVLLSIQDNVIAQKTPFTIADAIKVKSMGSQNLSDDGKYLAGLISDGSARFNVDHFRFQDPSYNNVFTGDFVIINTATSEEIRPFKTATKVTSISWAPNSKELAFLEQKGEKLHLMHFDLERKKLKEIKIKGMPLLANSALTWTPDSEYLLVNARDASWMARAMALYNEATNGPIVVYDGNKPFLKWDEIRNTNALTTILKVNKNDGEAEQVLEESNYSGIYISEDGQHLIFNETFPTKTAYVRNEGAEYQVAYKNLSNPDSTYLLYKKNKQRRNFNWSDSKSKYAWIDSGHVFVQTLGADDVKNLTKGKAYSDEEKKKEVKFSIMTWSPQEGQLLLSSDKGYWLVDTDGENLKMVYEFPEDKEKAPNLNLANWSKDERYLYFSYSDKNEWKRGFVKYDLAEQKMEDIRIDSNLYSGVQFAKDSETVVLNLSDGNMPSDVVVTNWDFGDMKPLTDLNPWMNDKKLTHSELITYRNVDGKELKGILYYPVDYEEGKKYPLVCEVYEGFFANGYNRNMNLFANQGYFALRPSVDLEMGYPGEAWVKGITAAINKLVDEGKVDNDKVGVQGGSYGGYATSLLITQTDRFAAAINISGKVNIMSFLGDSPKIGTRNYTAAEYGQDRIGGTLWDEPLKYLATTAVLHADRIKTPHMIMTGEGDWNVPGTNSRELYYAMRRLGKDVVWVNYLNGGHGAGAASNESDFHDHWNRVFEFYEKHFNKEKKDKTTE
ncbi:dipeptidyl aminopeptidase/acylaminoacyl peptidase [Belliella baltica DSM 15883]|uniref:Dipeptidyl aminopeptidase/acylaminoacyl peptidase n=1 Tax=Belliella baltica (strain DSM 15883 / CIP 108006 / LMG 21964 / BA134) TaxID=866536 RepID=I3Z8Y1_BELBD|nr:prolyl oligopeptidase family serine peptidase [Belliella baltica]AFL85699.1 dipeptidyl aminopeptidase/acylaminoacyl peptidase [Belliella baltica DSM 15883]